VIAKRDEDRPEGSYTTDLLEAGVKRIAQKVGEEGVETALAAAAGGDEEVLNESADLIYHLLVLLRSRKLELGSLVEVLKNRHGA
jgi:phosphoribosyl-ATP pyrophosphohydrolase/phosphoribosyl-AMP cyclohydrolase